MAGLFGIAIVHKLRVLRRGKAASHALLRDRDLDSGFAALLFACAAGVEIGVVATLIFFPTVGLALGAVVLVFYARQLDQLHPDADCECFGEKLAATRAAEGVRRNLALAASAAIVAAAYLTGLVDVEPISQLSVGIALLIAAFAVPWAIHRRLADRGPVLA